LAPSPVSRLLLDQFLNRLRAEVKALELIKPVLSLLLIRNGTSPILLC
jgi:hypothetical protein